MDQKTEKQGKRIVAAEVLAGLEIYNPQHSTIFTLALETEAEGDGQKAWLLKKIPEWELLLNKESGAMVIESGLGPSAYIGSRFKIILKLVIAGGLQLDKVDPDIKEMLQGQYKKVLAQKILRDFPPPFDVKKPLYAAGVEDRIYLHSTKGSYAHNLWGDELLAIVTGSVINSSDFAKVLAAKNCEFVEFRTVKVSYDKRCLYGVIAIKWRNDVSKEDRYELTRSLHDYFEKLASDLGWPDLYEYIEKK